MIRLYWFLSVLIFVSCSSKKQTAATETAPPPPGWVDNRPITSAYYVGIGVAPKAVGSNFQRAAKENALSDLASEIKVNVNSNSLLYTLEREYKFEQEFRETIRTKSDLDLEDYEIVDSWEDGKSYWVYYRLNKAAYADAILRKKNSAQELGLDFLAKAEAAKNSGRYAVAVDYYLRGLQAIEDFWNEENKVDYQGQTILLDNTLFTGLKTHLNDLRISIENPLVLNFENKYKTTANVLATALDEAPQESVQLAYTYFGTYGIIRGKLATNADGRGEIAVVEVDKERASNSIRVFLDTETLFEPFESDRFMQKLTETMRGTEIQKPILYMPPAIYIISNEENLGRKMDGTPLTSAIMTSLGRRGIRFTNSKADADLILNIDADTRKAGSAQGFNTSNLAVNIDFTDVKSGESRYSVSKNNLKGVDLDYEKAGLKAYQNLTRNIESELMRTIVNDLF